MQITFPISVLIFFLPLGMSLPFTRSPTAQPTLRPSLPVPTRSPTFSPTFRPTISPTVEECITVTVGLFDTGRDGWSGNILTMTGSKTETPEVTLQLPSGLSSQYHYLCLPDDTYTVTCCQGTGDYDEISWNMIVSTTAESLSGGASAICEETEQTLKVKSSSYDDDISPPLSTQEILLISVVLPIGLTVCIFAIVCCCLKGNRCTMSKETEDIVHRSNQILKSRGGVPLPPRRDIPMNPVVPSNNTSASSSAYSNYSSSPMHTTSSSSPSGYGGSYGYGGSSTPSAPPAPGESDVLKNAFPEFYAKNQTTSYGYS
jgi:hypothetical protein